MLQVMAENKYPDQLDIHHFHDIQFQPMPTQHLTYVPMVQGTRDFTSFREICKFTELKSVKKVQKFCEDFVKIL